MLGMLAAGARCASSPSDRAHRPPLTDREGSPTFSTCRPMPCPFSFQCASKAMLIIQLTLNLTFNNGAVSVSVPILAKQVESQAGQEYRRGNLISLQTSKYVNFISQCNILIFVTDFKHYFSRTFVTLKKYCYLNCSSLQALCHSALCAPAKSILFYLLNTVFDQYQQCNGIRTLYCMCKQWSVAHAHCRLPVIGLQANL